MREKAFFFVILQTKNKNISNKVDKNTIIGFALIAAVLFGFTWYNQPSKEQMEAKRKQDSITNTVKQKAEQQRMLAEQQRKKELEEKEQGDSTALFFNAKRGVAQQVVLQNEKLALTFSTKGAVVEKAVVKNFEDNEGNKDVTLFDKNTQRLNFTLAAKETNIETSELYFKAIEKTANSVTFVADAGEGKSLEIKYVLGKDYWNCGYMSEALKAASAYLFSRGYRRILIEADENNAASNKVIAKNGFVLTHKETKPCSRFKPETVTVNWYCLTENN